MAIEVRPTRSDEWVKLRSLRLSALRESPWAFASSANREERLPEEEWRRRAGAHNSVTMVATDDEAWVGMAAGIYEDVQRRRVQLVGMWVRPQSRGKGIGSLLVEAVCGWAEQHGAREVTLWVADGNAVADRLYRRLAFSPTGARQPLPSDPSVEEHELKRALKPPCQTGTSRNIPKSRA